MICLRAIKGTWLTHTEVNTFKAMSKKLLGQEITIACLLFSQSNDSRQESCI